MKEVFYSRKDIMNEYLISRRVIEGYENIGLIKPSKNDERGGLLYDQKTLCRVGFIRVCQRIGFELKDIIKIIDLPEDELANELNKQIKLAKDNINNLDNLLNTLDSLIKERKDPRNTKQLFTMVRKETV